ncbi:MAG: hypothetical protein RIR33_116 [Pseudomonadota bacterium]|jgi:uncharacterized glyoxalase superfamily protein PhnB
MTHPAITPALFYRDPRAALAFLHKAFGFELELLIEDEHGGLQHSQLRFGGGLIMVGTEWDEKRRSPASVEGRNTQTIHVHLAEQSADAHCTAAKAAGAEILVEPANQFYGERTYQARDPEGHIWSFAQTIGHVEPADWDKATGLRTWAREGYGKA